MYDERIDQSGGITDTNMDGAAGIPVVFGAGGGLGGAIVRTLAGRQKPVRGITRRGPDAKPPGVPPAVPLVAADASDPAAASRACEGASVIYPSHRPPQRPHVRPLHLPFVSVIPPD